MKGFVLGEELHYTCAFCWHLTSLDKVAPAEFQDESSHMICALYGKSSMCWSQISSGFIAGTRGAHVDLFERPAPNARLGRTLERLDNVPKAIARARSCKEDRNMLLFHSLPWKWNSGTPLLIEEHVSSRGLTTIHVTMLMS